MNNEGDRDPLRANLNSPKRGQSNVTSAIGTHRYVASYIKPMKNLVRMNIMALLAIIQTGSKLDFVHLSRITDGVNQALKKSRGDFNHLVFVVDL